MPATGVVDEQYCELYGLPTKWIGLELNPAGDTSDSEDLDYINEVWSKGKRVVLDDAEVQPRLHRTKIL